MLPIPLCPSKFLKKSSPPINIKNIKITTICIYSFCLLGKILDIRDNINIGKPRILGMYEVIELLSLIKLMTIPHKKRKTKQHANN